MAQEILAIASVVGEVAAGVPGSSSQVPPSRQIPGGLTQTQPWTSTAATSDGRSGDLRTLLQGFGLHLDVGIAYEIDRETKQVIIKVIDKGTKEVLRQIPPEELVKLSSALRHAFGLLFHAEV